MLKNKSLWKIMTMKLQFLMTLLQARKKMQPKTLMHYQGNIWGVKLVHDGLEKKQMSFATYSRLQVAKDNDIVLK
ncbi:hypothetical protein HanRHA438_Chr01g0012441 [Helianthus annuus]|uniref:Uncharacterized protein n=1 Tax=Helianthus annuus TaxID=4232 RepID=A0A251TXV6_HELAN|nr:hypothetical protein HanXRQr2_Chr01g0012031 [Helianthus annuus]KAJ0947194.1 hypothetical protein HanRHA438_Chr01g0012441 [Helianthus annuus]